MSIETATTTALRCVIVTPEETVLDTEAEFVALPLFDGEVGIAQHHSPLIGRLGYGELRIRTSDDTRRFYVDGGFVQVADNVVSVLTNRAVSSEKIDTEVLQEQLTSAMQGKFAGEEQLAMRDRVLSQTRGQLRVARRAK